MGVFLYDVIIGTQLIDKGMWRHRNIHIPRLEAYLKKNQTRTTKCKFSTWIKLCFDNGTV